MQNIYSDAIWIDDFSRESLNRLEMYWRLEKKLAKICKNTTEKFRERRKSEQNPITFGYVKAIK